MIPNAIAFEDAEGNYQVSSENEREIRKQLKQKLGLVFYSALIRAILHPVLVPRIRYQIATSDYVLKKSLNLLQELKQFALINGVNLSVVILYPRDSVQGGFLERWTNSRKAGQMVYKFCMDNEINAVDLIDVMHTRADKEKYFYSHDGHPNREGNHIIAQTIFDKIVKPKVMYLH